MLAISVQAYSILPTERNNSALLVDKYDAKMCASHHANYCIDNICQLSNKRDCVDRCRVYGIHKCGAQTYYQLRDY